MSTPFAPLSGADSVTDETPAAPEVVELSGPALAYYAEWVDALDERRQLDQRIEDARGRLQAAIGEAAEARIDGRPVISWRPHTRRDLDRARVRELLGADVYEACHKSTTVRPFRQVTE